ncbi:S8 family serine peptidase [Thermobrachium celere]|uniref:Alkaline serine protease n=1 Tax=Thermobrachium celere DSM 8682 TaxID=941824 RepID=R7RSJ3_9CLOT|nr:S8 family serine peptidase [Thermobrachium celere]CDF59004.1 alkaline serine protease [Thermobrachium celere DSM 8682]
MFWFLNKKIDKKLKEYMNINSKRKIPVIVTYKNNLKSSKNSIVYNGGKIKYEYKIINAIACELSPISIDKVTENPDISYICFDYKAMLCLNNISQTIGVKFAHSLSLTGKDIGIALIDTGCFPHPDLISNKNSIVYFKDFINNISKPYDDHGHGTFLSGIIASSGHTNKSYKGIAPDSKLCIFKCFDSLGYGYMSDIIIAIESIILMKDEFNIRIVCLPFEFPYINSLPNNPLEKAINKLIENNIVPVVSSGNLGPQSMSIYFPGNMKDVITVGGAYVDSDRKTIKIANFSGRGPTIDGINKPDLVVPCINVLSLNCDRNYNPLRTYKYSIQNPYTYASGTSISSAVISGCIALLLEYNPNLTVKDIKSILILSSKSIGENKNAQGAGMFVFDKILKK